MMLLFMKSSVAAVWALALTILCLGERVALAQTTLVATGSVWKYLDTGVDQGTAWREPGFDDSGWSNGVAQLGFGEGDEATVLRQTNADGVTNLTFYFRQAFNVVNPSVYTNLLLRLQRDDGAVVYLNGTEVFRSNMPLGPVNYDTLAAITTPDDGKNVFASAVKPALLTNGLNLLAVEVHQATTNSSDITFDLGLLGNAPLSLIPLISQGAAWKYLDDGSEPGTAWVAPTFDDSGWSNGVAQLGFGEADEATQIRQFSTLTGT